MVRARRSANDMTIMQHLAELRTRLVVSIFAIAVGAVVLLLAYEPVLNFLVSPYRDLCAENKNLNCDGSLYALGPIDGFAARMRRACRAFCLSRRCQAITPACYAARSARSCAISTSM